MVPAPICAFLVSTKVPILPASPSTVPGRRYAYGPTDAPAPIRDADPCARTTAARGPTATSVSVVSGPTSAPSPTVVAPRSWVFGSTTTSRSSVTVTSIHTVVGSTMLTPARIQSSLIRSRSSARSWASWTRSLTPSASSGSSVRWVPTG